MNGQCLKDNKSSYILRRIAVLIIGFIIYSFIGWAYEVILTSIVAGHFVDRGVLALPLCPIYGVFSMGALLFFRRRKHPVYVIIMGMVLSTVFELICSYITEAVMGYKLWDYSLWPFNFEGRISLFSSVIFGVLCLLPVNIIDPFLKSRLCPSRQAEPAPVLLKK